MQSQSNLVQQHSQTHFLGIVFLLEEHVIPRAFPVTVLCTLLKYLVCLCYKLCPCSSQSPGFDHPDQNMN